MVRGQKQVWLNNGYVDQMHMYQSPEAVENWKNLLKDNEYRSNTLCQRSLQRLLLSPEWKSLIEFKGDGVTSGMNEAGDDAQNASNDHPSGRGFDGSGSIMFLGCGAPEKEFSIIQQLIDIGKYSENNRLRVFLNDGSFHMLMDSYIELLNRCRRLRITDKLDIDPFVEDFTKFTGQTAEKLRGENGRALFFILGNTLGNNDESRFLDSIRRVSTEGDILVVNAEFVDSDNLDEYLRSLQSNYSATAARDLVLGPVRTLLDEFSFPESRMERRNRVYPKINSTPNYHRASIAKTVTLQLMVDLDQVELSLSISKRYDREQFINFFEDNGFQLAFDIVYADRSSSNGQAVILRS